MPIDRMVSFIPYSGSNRCSFPANFVARVEKTLPDGETVRLQQLMGMKNTGITGTMSYTQAQERKIFIDLCGQNPGLSLSQLAALQKITEFPMEGLYMPGISLFGLPGKKSASKGARLLKKIQIFQALERLGVIDRKQGGEGIAKVGEIVSEYEQARETVAHQMRDILESKLNLPSHSYLKLLGEIDNIIGPSALNNLLETGYTTKQAEEILRVETTKIRNYPLVQGFEEAQEDTAIPNALVRGFLFNAFGPEALKQFRIDEIVKSDQYFLYYPLDNKELKEWLESSIEGCKVFSPNRKMFCIDSRTIYLQIAKRLENVDDTTKLSNPYCRLGTVNDGCFDYCLFKTIRLFNFAFQRPADHAYLMDLQGYSDEDRIRIHILSTIAHEIGHIYVQSNPIDGYINATQEERKEKPYVTDYIRLHAEIFNSNTTLEDDFCESIRLYVSNAEYLQRNFPARYDFIRQHLPFIRANAARDAIVAMNSRKQ